MCAINGFLRIPSHRPVDIIDDMNKANSFRGPDGTSRWFDNKICLGHNLLSISGDPETSVQPVRSKKGNYLVYNGEHFDIEGYDTDYLCDMLDHYGISYLKNINAHFALAWYEPEKNQVTIARDHYGVKPLFYYRRDQQLAFSSSIHGICAYQKVCIDYFKAHEIERTIGYHIGNMTIYKDVYSLNMGEYITFDVLSARVVSNGWLHDFTLEPVTKTDSEIRDLIYESVESVSKTNKKLAVGVSGGLDSTTLAYILNEKNIDCDMITMMYETDEDNSYTQDWKYAKDFYKSIDRQPELIALTKERSEEFKQRSIDATMMPMQDYDRQICRHILCHKASEIGAKVILTGDGSDEIFTGYVSHSQLFSISEDEQKAFFKSHYDQWRPEKHGNFPSHVFGPDHLNNFLFLDLFKKCQTYNISTDAHAGYYGIESRIPFLRQKIVKTMMCVPSKDKIKIIEGLDLNTIGNTKYYLRHLFRDDLPQSIITRRMKSGFSLPWGSLTLDVNLMSRNQQFRNLRKIIAEKPIQYQ